jgi:hypothetical protein
MDEDGNGRAIEFCILNNFLISFFFFFFFPLWVLSCAVVLPVAASASLFLDGYQTITYIAKKKNMEAIHL